MEQLILHNFDVYSIEIYNCRANNISSRDYTITYGKPRLLLGFLDIVYGIIIEIIYLPCLTVMMRKENIRHSCFKIMLVLGFIDMLAIGINSIETGFFLIEGAVFCSHPTLIYISGSVGLGVWCSACLVCLILGLNRVFDILYPTLVKRYFAGHRTSAVLLIPITYGLYFTFFTSPALFTSQFQAWFFDPFLFPGNEDKYTNYSHTANNLFVVVATCLLYGYFCRAISDYLKNQIHSNQRNTQLQIVIQTAIICLTNFFASMVYVYMNFFPVPEAIIVMGHISWQIGHGCPAIIYLCMNTTIRNGIVKLLTSQNRKVSNTISLASSTNKNPA